jgi:hypothetical protein
MLLCRIGQELNKSLEEVAELSLAEMEIWIAYFNLQAKEQERRAKVGRAGR